MAVSLSASDVAEKKTPKYLVVRRAILRRIERGDYALGTALPSENELAQEFETTRMTVRNALDGLVDEGVIRRIQGKGTFIAGLGEIANTSAMGFREMAENADAAPSVRLLSRTCRVAGPYYAELLGIDPYDAIFCVRRLNSADGVPVSIEQAYIPLALFPGIEDRDIEAFSLYETYAIYGHEVVGTQERLGITRLGARDAGLLGVEVHHPAIRLDCKSFDREGVTVEYVRARMLGDRGGYAFVY